MIGELATIVKGIGPPDILLTEDESSSSYLMPVALPEDSFLRGYAPILNAQVAGFYTAKNNSKVSQ